ncbi:MAG: hypothetical protein PHF21_03425, partial [Bacilli bacterium]|nr:hypothetical protein [Bacilli bacterium]
MKYLKIFIVLLASLFVFNTGVNAANKNTIAALREELAAHKKSYNQAASNANRTKAEINASKGKIFSSHDEIKKNKELIEKAKVEIETLNVDIAKKDEDIKKYMNALQKTMGNNIYLEYLLDAKNYADLVYRYAIIEQVADYDKKQIESFEKQIEKNKELQVELAAREIKLNELISNLEKTVKSLGKEYDDLMEITLDVKEQLKAMEQYIAYLISIGCKENDDIDACIGQHGDSGFIRPVPYGTITSYYGYRKNPITGKKQSWHGAIDIGGMKEGSNVYSAANGTVALILRKQSCGGNMVYIHHNISG